MKYIITGGSGHISKPLALALLDAGHQVTVVGRNAAHLDELVGKGARVAIGSVEDVPFLTKAFAGADAVYLMTPPNFTTNDTKGFYEQVAKNYAQAIKGSTIRYAVNLSSIGAHLAEGVGPVNGLYRGEQVLNKLEGVHVKHLRPSYFYYNLYSNIDLIRNMGIMGGNFSIAANKFPIVDPADIAQAAAEELLQLNFTGNSFRYIASDETGTDAIAKTIGQAIGKADLQWVHFTDEQAYNGMLQAGLSEDLARNYIEMGNAMNSGIMFEDYWKNHPGKPGKTSLADFARTFATVYSA